MTGIDPLQVPFDRERGYAIAHRDNVVLLLYRVEDLPGGLAAGLSALLARPIDAVATENRAVGKPYASLYREFRERFRIPRDLAEWIYATNVIAQHFYSDEEIEGFVRKWSE